MEEDIYRHELTLWTKDCLPSETI